MKRSLTIAIASIGLLCGGLAPALQAQPVTGAIFTTLGDGTVVNANHFESKCAVYLDGGPGPNAPAKAAGLPDGEYYFQVTDPSGKTLLSTDPVSNRRFQVSGGVIVAYTGFGGPVHPVGVDNDHAELGAITIRLANSTCEADFLNSPNNGGAYKVWATPVSDFVGDPSNVDNPCGNGCYHGFLPSKSKTDNFKASAGTATFCLTVVKEIQTEDGGWSPVAEWPIYVTDPLGITNLYFTDVEAGQVRVCGLTASTLPYVVREDLAEYSQAALIVNGEEVEPVEPVYSFVWSPGKPEPVIVFRNIPPGGGGEG